MKPTRAMVLAAGLGNRMRPLSALRAKPVLPVMNRPFISHVLDHLASFGVSRAVVNTHHLPATLEEAVSRWTPEGLEVIFSHEEKILGTAGGLRKAARHFRDETFFVVNSDSISDTDLAVASAAHDASGRMATLVVREHDAGSGYRPVHVASGGEKVGELTGIADTTWNEVPSTPRTFIGVHVMEPQVLDAIASKGASDLNAHVYPRLIKEHGPVVGTWLHEGWWFEAGNPARYLELNMTLLKRSGRDAVVGPGFFIDDDARVAGSVIGSNSRLERESGVEGSVLWKDVSLGPGARVRSCVVTEGVVIPPDTLWEGQVLTTENSIVVSTPLVSA